MRIRTMSPAASRSTPARAMRLVLPTMVSVIALTASLEAKADGYFVANDESFDYSGTVNGTPIPGFTSTPGSTVYPGLDAAIISSLHAPDALAGTGNSNSTNFEPNFWAGPPGQNNFGGPSNTPTGWISAFDPTNSGITSSTGTWNATHTVFTLNITGTTPNDPTDLSQFNRVWAPTGTNTSYADQQGYYTNYNLTLSANFASGAVTETNPFLDWFSTTAAPTSITGSFNGTFVNNSTSTPSNNGTYNVALNFNNINWAANNGVPDTFTGVAPYFGATDCPSPTASCNITYGTTGPNNVTPGLSISLLNQVTAGPNALQAAVGGDGFDGYDGGFVAGGAGGNGNSDLTIANVTSAVSTGMGGNGGIGFGPGGAGGDGSASLTLSNATTGMVGAFGGFGGWAFGGGDGGAGGNATVNPSTMTNVNNGTFEAVGGNGGQNFGGLGNGGAGGNALVDNSSISGDVTGTFISTGGNGGDVFGTGNGGAGGTGQINNASVTGINPTDPVTLIATATGGNGGQGNGATFSGGAGGAGVINGPNILGISQNQVAPGSGTVQVTASQIGGNGGNGVNNASGGAGAASLLDSKVVNNATILALDVNGFTTGELDLALNATGGNGGNGDGTGLAAVGAAGSATLYNDQSGLLASQQASSLNGTATGTGGNGGGGTGGANGADGGVGAAATTMIGGNNVSATSNVIGGNGGDTTGGGNAGNGASATNGVIPVTLTSASSTSTSSVTVSSTTNATGGNGGTSFTGAGNGGNGGNATLVDATVGNVGTGGGILTLNQNATAGNGGGSFGGTAGFGGNSTSVLSTADATATDLRVNLGATGGNGGPLGSGTFIPGTSNGGTALVGGVISGLDAVTINANATAGDGGSASGAGNFSANGQSISVVNPLTAGVGLITGTSTTGNGPVIVNATETAGNGGTGANGAFAGNGGNAVLTNAVGGVTTGALTLSQTANAGNGGDADVQNGGNGGIAVSNLNVTSILTTTLTGTTTANGGNGGNGGSNAGIGGGAVANTVLDTDNAVFATANANGGAGSSGGAATATANATGSSGLAAANATTPGTGPVFQVQAHANGTVGSTTIANANTNIGGNVPNVTVLNPTGLMPAFVPGFSPNSFAFATGLPNQTSINQALAGPPAHPNNTAVWTQPTSFVAGAGLQGAAFNGTIGVSHTYNTETDYNFSVPFGKGTLLTVGLLNGDSFGTLSGVDSLTLLITDNGNGIAPLTESFLPAGVSINPITGLITFNSLAAADAFFSDDVLTFGALAGTNTIGIDLDLTASDAVGFQGNFLVGTSGPAGGGGGPAGVPEPGTLAIFLSAILGWLGIRYRPQRSGNGARMA